LIACRAAERFAVGREDGIHSRLHVADLESHLREAVLDRVGERRRQIGKQTRHAIAQVDHTHPATGEAAALELLYDRRVDAGGDNASDSAQTVRRLEPRRLEDDAFILRPQLRITDAGAGVDDRADVTCVDLAAAEHAESLTKDMVRWQQMTCAPEPRGR
jgi:hypothetical protein